MPKAPASALGKGGRPGPSVEAGEPIPAWRTQAAYGLGGRSGADERGPALGPSGGSDPGGSGQTRMVQPLRAATLEASADFLLAAWFLWMTPFETALSS